MRPIWKILIVAAVVAGSLAVFLLVMPGNREKIALENYRNQLKQQGEKMNVAELAPSVSPTDADQGKALVSEASLLGNLNEYPRTMHWIAPGHALVGWRETISPTYDLTNCWPTLDEALKRNEETLAAVRATLDQSGLGFPLDYQAGFSMGFPHLLPIKEVSLWLMASTELKLHEHDTNGAWENLLAEANLVRKNSGEPIIISQLVRIAITQIAIADIWEALQYPGWSDAQLQQLQTNWEGFDLLDHVEPALDMERDSLRGEFDYMRTSFSNYNNYLNPLAFGSSTPRYETLSEIAANPPEGIKAHFRYGNWKSTGSYEEELVTMKVCQAAVEASRRFRTNESFVLELNNFEQEVTNILKVHAGWEKRFATATNFLGSNRPGEFASRFLVKIAVVETERRMVVTAIALERYRLQHGEYPAALAELTPAILKSVPIDLMDGKPLRYRKKNDGVFLLYSVGEDGKDDGGDGSPPQGYTSSYKIWYKMRDVVWPMPATVEEVQKYEADTLRELRKPTVTNSSSR
jgi:hypothetical protein